MVKLYLQCVGRERATLLYMAVKKKADVGCNGKSGLHLQAIGVKYTHRTKLRFMLCVFRPCRGQIYASVNYKCCHIYACAGYGNEFVNGCLSIHSR